MTWININALLTLADLFILKSLIDLPQLNS